MSKDYIIHTKEEIEGIRKAGEAAAYARKQIALFIKPGITTKQIDEYAEAVIASTGGTSAFYLYRNYPGQICISVNEEIIHGIGGVREIVGGDIVSIDVGVNLNGFIGDNAETVKTGPVSDKVEELLKQTENALYAGIKKAVAGNYVRDISIAIENVAKRHKIGVVRGYVGHGCGCELHEPPEVPNFKNAKGPMLRPGMVLAIEPMFNRGTYKTVTEADGWTVRTKDFKMSAHFEHTVLITDSEPEILTI